jgi:pimeloyl-ACP methyl ester carboxylesterase
MPLSDAGAALRPTAARMQPEADAGARVRPQAAGRPAPAHKAAVVDASCEAAGCIRSLREAGTYAKVDIEAQLDDGVSIANGYNVFVIEYVTGDRSSLATVTIPYPLEPAAQGYPMVVNAHGTSGLDDACQLSNTAYATGLAGLFGARGAIGIAPDGPGLGTPGLLPYMVSESAGRAVLDAMRAATNLAELMQAPVSKRYAAVGLSEGGHSVLAAAAQHANYAPELDVRAFAVAAPASMWFEKWQAGIGFDGSGVSSYAMLFYAWADYYHYSGPSLWADGIAARIGTVMTTACAFDLGGTRKTYEQELGGQADAVFNGTFLSAFRAGTLPPSAATLTAAFAENRIGPYHQTAPLGVFQGDSDTVVLQDDTTELVRSLQQAGVQVDYHIVLGGGHGTTAYGFVNQRQVATEQSIQWVRERLDD